MERRQEGDHSLLNRGSVLRKTGGSYVSMVLRMPEILRLFDPKNGSAESELFVAECASIIDPDMMAARLGYLRHPLYKQAIEEKASCASSPGLSVHVLC